MSHPRLSSNQGEITRGDVISPWSNDDVDMQDGNLIRVFFCIPYVQYVGLAAGVNWIALPFARHRIIRKGLIKFKIKAFFRRPYLTVK